METRRWTWKEGPAQSSRRGCSAERGGVQGGWGLGEKALGRGLGFWSKGWESCPWVVRARHGSGVEALCQVLVLLQCAQGSRMSTALICPQKTVYGANVIVFEGILAFANKELLKLLDMKVFVDTDSDIRLVRRLQRDIMERGRDIVGVIKQYNKFVKPAFEQYIEPTVQVADIVVPRGGENFVALDLIVQHVHSQLEKREITVRAALASAHQGQPLPKTLSVLENTPQVRGMHTIIRNKDTTRDEFIFYSKRLMRLLIEHALSFLPLKSVTVETPQGTMYEGKRFHRQRITGVSILRAGETMEQALTAVCKDIRLGKILIQTNHDTGEPELHYLRLPKEISEDYVILMDSTVSTGAAAMMAVRVLLDHDVQEDRIFLLSLLMAEMGVHSVAYAFPRVRIITTAVDKRINEEFHIIPGIGNFGDRYFGTDGPSAWCESDGMDC
uniref:uridine/cytidine kinase n=1 Tax=Buteo japonicus TaxID=224669 RepID=A0A8C0BI94_9AVES